MRALGLSTSDPHHEGFYRAMRVSSPGPIAETRLTASRMRQLQCTTDCRPIAAAWSTLRDKIRASSPHSSGTTSTLIAAGQRVSTPGSRRDQARRSDSYLTVVQPMASMALIGSPFGCSTASFVLGMCATIAIGESTRAAVVVPVSFIPRSSQRRETDNVAGHGGCNGEAKVYDPARNAYRPK